MRFQIKTGPFLNIAVGPGIMGATEYFTNKLNENKMEIVYSVPMVHAGLAYVKRIAPLKINGGIFVNFALPITSYSYEVVNNNSFVETNEEADIDFISSPGIRAGAEFLVGSHFGFGAELVLQYWPRYEIEFDFDEFDLYSTTNLLFTQEIQYSALKIGLSANIYF